MAESNQCFTIGDTPIENTVEACLNFHQYEIFNNQWPSSGTVKYDAVEKKFYILPDVVVPEQQVEPEIPL